MTGIDLPEDDVRERLAYRDGKWVAGLIPLLRLVVKTWYRSEVTGMEKMPEGGALMVSNHSGGLIAMDVPVIAVAFHDMFGADRPLYVLAHDLLFLGPERPGDAARGLPARDPRERPRRARVRGRDHRVPGWRLRRVPPVVAGDHHRLRRPQGLRAARRCARASRSSRS